MPKVLIEVRRAAAPELEARLMDAVHAALREAFNIPEWDRTVRLIAHEPHRLQVSPRLAHPERFTMVTIDCFAGRSLAAKRALYAAITRNLVALGIPADHVLVLLREAPLENWGVRGGQPACDVDLGFQVNV
jgi:phenylpyruvate tautomerase PptA (4-oxalocrotonate tautomerase family)